MISEASITGLFRTVFILIGVYVLLKFIGRVLLAKRALDNQRQELEKEKQDFREKKRFFQNLGKTEVINPNSSSPRTSQTEDVDYEEVDK